MLNFMPSEFSVLIANFADRSKEMETMFAKVVIPSFEMVSSQVKAAQAKNDNPVSMIILCRGMAGSGYIQKQFDQFCAQILGSEAEVIVPRDPWSAIAKGAVLHALKPTTVGSRKSRWSFGIGVHRAFDPELDGNENRYKCPSRGQRVNGCVKWFIKQEESIKDKVKWIHGYITMKSAGRRRDTVGDLLLYRSRDSDPGERIDDPGVEQFATLRIRIPSQLTQADKKVMIGFKIDVNEKSVGFEARCGRKMSDR
ncbi:hypothetical protein AJ79_02768 [Helicocarpus griseus UAMH5409]|uniref:Uncharacterized protein n=1 Tax=Helicocarpus griseus UAMH5409 TaxID=1447875 RepID=A0A2B7Y133_9EURO|nr:hypothetical protein AJ79_02768 [Helicocarpus griseus UAMH5409]